MKFVTVATHSENYHPTLKNSLEHAGVRYAVLGWGKKWTGFMMKFELMIEWLKYSDPGEVICFMDGFDSFFLGDPKMMELKFKNSKAGIIFSRYSCPYGPMCMIIKKLIGRVFNNAYDDVVNTGLYIGYAGAMRPFLQEVMLTCTGTDDEKCINESRHLFKKYKIEQDDGTFFKNSPTIPRDLTAFAYGFPGGYTINNSIINALPFKVERIPGGTMKRIFRMPYEYFQFLKFDILILFLCLTMLYLFFF